MVDKKEVVDSNQKDKVEDLKPTNEEKIKLDKEDKEFNKKAMRLAIEQNKIKKDLRDIEIKSKEKEVEMDYPTIASKDTIKDLEGLIDRKKVRLENNQEIDAQDSDLVYMKIRLLSEKESLNKGIPLRKAKLKLDDLKLSLDSPDSFEKAIKDLEKKIIKIDRNHEASKDPSWVA